MRSAPKPGALNTKMSSPRLAFIVSLPAPPVITSLPAPPSRKSLPLPPTMKLSRTLPVPVKLPEPTKNSASTLASRLWLESVVHTTS
ncbi:hypothetical protein D9M71_633840 [compost metagenome]